LRDREVRAILRQLLDELIASYASDERGVEIREIAGGYRMATKPECHDAVRSFVKSLKPALRLSLPALETLAVIAYKQPVTAPEVNEIRGVDSSAVFGTLLARKLIATAGRKQVIGRPILYKTTREFLVRFGLKDVSELPSMEEFEKMAELEFEEPEPAAEGEAAPVVNEDLSLEVDGTADEPADEPAANAAPEIQEGPETNAAAASEDPAATQEPESTELSAGSPANQAETTSAEAAPAAPHPTEQAETETVPHD
jgi:segregation and condensation protein B